MMKDSDDTATKDESDVDDDRQLPDWMLAARERDASTPPNRGDAPPARNDDENRERAANLAAAHLMRQPCAYGEHCYRRNPAHRGEFSHPGDSDYSPEQEIDEDNRPECRYGTDCYRQNPRHKREFKHTRPPVDESQTVAKAEKPHQQPVKRRRKADDGEYEPPGEDEYDLSDPFIDDSEKGEEEEEEEEEEESTDDDDYVPENNADLLNEDEWQESPGDAPEVLELLKEARDYLRNKKMQK